MKNELCICGHAERWHTLNRCMRCDDDTCMHKFQPLEMMTKEYSEAIYGS